MMRRLLTVLLWCGSFAVQAERLDDALSPRQQIDIPLDWKYQDTGYDDPNDSRLNALTAQAQHVEIRLNTARFVDRRARIYIGLPLNVRGTVDSTALRMSWTTNGRFANGSVTAGNRARLFEGTITEEVMTDVFELTFQIDARQVLNTIRFQPVYEIELLDN
jgi:hypothetical protein